MTFVRSLAAFGAAGLPSRQEIMQRGTFQLFEFCGGLMVRNSPCLRLDLVLGPLQYPGRIYPVIQGNVEV